MNKILHLLINSVCISGALLLLPSCNGILSGIYDEPEEETGVTVSGQLYIDASDWTKWHYIDLADVAEKTAVNPDFNPSSEWKTFDIPLERDESAAGSGSGIYTYWYDVFGEGISQKEFRDSYPVSSQKEPESWTFAVHRNNVRTNGGAVAATDFRSISELPESSEFLKTLLFTPDSWNETDVWVIQERMLSGLIGNQGIQANGVLSSWLRIDIPPMPPAFTHDNRVFILRLSDGSFAALQLENYVSSAGTKCCLTINYKYPL